MRILVLLAVAALSGTTLAAFAADADSTAKRGDPTGFATRFEVRDEYRELESGGRLNLIVPRLDYAVDSATSLRVEIPFVVADPDTPLSGRQAGLGDLLLRGNYRALRGDGFALVVGGELILDTSTNEALGFGKNIVAPLAFVSIDIPRYDSVLFPFFQHYITIGGGGSRPDVHYTSIKTAVLTRWPDLVYTVIEPQLTIDHERNDHVGMTLEAEFGRFLERNLALWIRPGVRMFGDGPPQSYNWNLQVGVRIMLH
jgi:hypothetical protein